MKTKAIIFDFVGVLAKKSDDYIPNKLIDEIDQLVGQVTDDAEFKKSVMGKYNLTDKEFDSTISKIANKYIPYKPIWDEIEKLDGYKLAIINNGTSLTIPTFKNNFQIEKYFKYFVSSAIEGIKKPDEKIYLKTCELLEVKPEECLFMDDNLENIKTAEKLGMKTIHWIAFNEGLINFTNYISKSII